MATQGKVIRAQFGHPDEIASVGQESGENDLLSRNRNERVIPHSLIEKIANRVDIEVQSVSEKPAGDASVDGIARVRENEWPYPIEKVELRGGARQVTIFVTGQDVLYTVDSVLEDLCERLPASLRQKLIRVARYGSEFEVDVVDLVRTESQPHHPGAPAVIAIEDDNGFANRVSLKRLYMVRRKFGAASCYRRETVLLGRNRVIEAFYEDKTGFSDSGHTAGKVQAVQTRRATEQEGLPAWPSVFGLAIRSSIPAPNFA